MRRPRQVPEFNDVTTDVPTTTRINANLSQTPQKDAAMKVSMNIEQALVAQGWFSPKKPVHNLRVNIEYSPEEIAAVQAAGLGEYELVKDVPLTEKQAQDRLMIWPEHGGCIPISVGFFIKTKQRVFSFSNAPLSARLRRWQKVSSCDAAA